MTDKGHKGKPIVDAAVIKGFQDALHESREREIALSQDVSGLKHEIADLRNLLVQALELDKTGRFDNENGK